MGNQYWFKPKVFGYGATPATWEGWAITAGYCVVIAIVTMIVALWITFFLATISMVIYFWQNRNVLSEPEE